MKIQLRSALVLLFAALLFTGCSVVSKEARREADQSITFRMVQDHPDQYIGKKVIWGGMILSTENKEGASEIEVLQTELSYDYSPKENNSEGRFIVESPRFLDSKIYKANKRITVAGVVKGTEVRKIGKMDYTYPVIVPFEMRLFEPPQQLQQGYYDQYMYQQPYPYGPYGPYGPWYPSPWPMYPYGPHPFGPFPYRPFPY